MNKIFKITSAILLLGSAALSAFPLTVTDKTAGIIVEAGFETALKADPLTAGVGELKVSRWHSSVAHTTPWQNGLFSVKAHYEYSDYKFASGGPISDGTELGLQATYMQHLLSQWSIFHISDISFAAERHASYTDAYIYTGMLALRYHLSENVVLGFGGYFEQELERDNFVIPIILLDWQISDRLRMYTANGLFFEYDLFNNDSSIFGFDISFQSKQYRLNHAETRAMREQYAAISLSYQNNLSENIYWKIYGEYLFARKFKTYRNEQKLSDIEIDNAFNMGIAAGMEF